VSIGLCDEIESPSGIVLPGEMRGLELNQPRRAEKFDGRGSEGILLSPSPYMTELGSEYSEVPDLPDFLPLFWSGSSGSSAGSAGRNQGVLEDMSPSDLNASLSSRFLGGCRQR
jgi:hypothetical protein